jgi:hypothetical protein
VPIRGRLSGYRHTIDSSGSLVALFVKAPKTTNRRELPPQVFHKRKETERWMRNGVHYDTSLKPQAGSELSARALAFGEIRRAVTSIHGM